MFDIAVIGKGPAGISAAINGAQRNKKIIIFGGDSRKVAWSPSISNYAGFIDIKGTDLVEALNRHLSSVKVELSDKRVIAVYSMGDYFSIQAEKEMIEAKTVILSVGVDFKKSIENEDKFLGNGVSYCATCDAPLYKGKTVVVVGYNEESYREADFLSEICSKIFFVPVFKMEYKFKGNVTLLDDSPLRFEGEMKAEKLVFKNSEIKADGFFVIKDSLPISSLVPGLETDGPHVKVDRMMKTNIKGLYAAGDITGKPYQIAKAVGEGQVAALEAVGFLSKK